MIDNNTCVCNLNKIENNKCLTNVSNNNSFIFGFKLDNFSQNEKFFICSIGIFVMYICYGALQVCLIIICLF